MTLSQQSQCSSIDYTLHGVFVEVLNLGVLITGQSGIGKSELALGLIDRGHKLIADDSVVFSRASESNDIVGSCPPLLQDFLEVRGLGILNIRSLFGDQAIIKSHSLHLIVNLMAGTPQELHYIDRLQGSIQQKSILDLWRPEITLPIFPGRNLAVLLECAVKNKLLTLSGYEAPNAFCQHQTKLINTASS